MRVAMLIGVVIAIVCTGCGGSGDSPKPQQKRTTSASSTTVTVTPSFPQAADGTNTQACHDGDCEILAIARIAIPLDRSFGFQRFTFDPADSTWRFTYAGGGSGSLKFSAPPYSGSWSAPYGKEGLNLRVVHSDGSKAVISLHATR